MHSIFLGMGNEFSTQDLAEEGEDNNRTSSASISIELIILDLFSYPIQESTLNPRSFKIFTKSLEATFERGIISLISLDIFSSIKSISSEEFLDFAHIDPTQKSHYMYKNGPVGSGMGVLVSRIPKYGTSLHRERMNELNGPESKPKTTQRHTTSKKY